MLKPRENLDKRISDEIKENVANKKYFDEKKEALSRRFGIPTQISTDILSMRTPIENESEFVLYAFMVVLFSPAYQSLEKKYFTPQEIKAYSKGKYIIPKAKLPKHFKMIEIAPDQWIGKIMARDLVLMREAQLINYNENTQRAPEIKNAGGTVILKIFQNKRSIEAMKELFRNGDYIPDIITLNLPSEAVHDYNEAEMDLVINTPYFDITDGYNRMVTLTRLCNLDRDFDYPMGLRITAYQEEKANQMIFQFNEQTKLKKETTESYNQNSLSTQIVENLNNDSSFVFFRQIGRGNKILDMVVLGKLIAVLFIPKSGSNEAKVRVTVAEQLKADFKTITESDESLFDKSWDNNFLCASMVCFRKKDTDISHIKKLHKKLGEKANKELTKNWQKLNGEKLLRLYDSAVGK